MTLVLAQGSLLSPFLPLNKVLKISSQTLDLLGPGGGEEGKGGGRGPAGSSPQKEKPGEGGGRMDFVKS